jgi:glucose uptake protein
MAVVAVVLVGKAYGALRATVVSRRGVMVCVISGLLMGIFAPFATRAMTRGNTLTPYTTAVFLTLGAFLCCFVFNTILMRKPIVGSPVSAGDYFRAPGSYHALGLLGGAIWGTGTVFNFVAAPGGSGNLVRDRTGIADGGLLVGSFCLERISRGQCAGKRISGSDVCGVSSSTGADRVGLRGMTSAAPLRARPPSD